MVVTDPHLHNKLIVNIGHHPKIFVFFILFEKHKKMKYKKKSYLYHRRRHLVGMEYLYLLYSRSQHKGIHIWLSHVEATRRRTHHCRGLVPYHLLTSSSPWSIVTWLDCVVHVE
jgi:hypothetical protein